MPGPNHPPNLNENPEVALEYPPEGVRFISQFTSGLHETATRARNADPAQAVRLFEDTIGAGYRHAFGGEAADEPQEAVQLVFLAESLGAVRRREGGAALYKKFQENNLLSDEEKARLSHMAHAVFGDRQKQIPDAVVAQRIAQYTSGELRALAQARGETGVPTHYEMAVLAFTTGAVIGQPGTESFPNRLITMMRQHQAEHTPVSGG